MFSNMPEIKHDDLSAAIGAAVSRDGGKSSTDEQRRRRVKRAVLPEHVRNEVADFIKAARAATGTTQEVFARRLGVSRKTLSVLEAGHEQGYAGLVLLDRASQASGRRLRLMLG